MMKSFLSRPISFTSLLLFIFLTSFLSSFSFNVVEAAVQTIKCNKSAITEISGSTIFTDRLDINQVGATPAERHCSHIKISNVKFNGGGFLRIRDTVASIGTLEIENVDFNIDSQLSSEVYAVGFAGKIQIDTLIIKNNRYNGTSQRFVYFFDKTNITQSALFQNNSVVQRNTNEGRFLVFNANTTVANMKFYDNKHTTVNSVVAAFLATEAYFVGLETMSKHQSTPIGSHENSSVILKNNYFNYSLVGGDLSAKIIPAYTSSHALFNVSYLELSLNKLFISEGVNCAGANGISFVSFNRIGVIEDEFDNVANTWSGFSPLQQQNINNNNNPLMTINITSNEIEVSQSCSPMSLLYCFQKVDHALIVIDNNSMTTKSGKGVELVDFDAHTWKTSIFMKNNFLKTEIDYPVKTLAPWYYPLYIGDGLTDVTVSIHKNEFESIGRKGFRCRIISSYGEISNASISIGENIFYVDVADNDLSTASLFSHLPDYSSFLNNCTLNLYGNEMTVTFMNESNSAVPQFTPNVAGLVASLRGQLSSTSPNSYQEIVSSKTTTGKYQQQNIGDRTVFIQHNKITVSELNSGSIQNKNLVNSIFLDLVRITANTVLETACIDVSYNTIEGKLNTNVTLVEISNVAQILQKSPNSPIIIKDVENGIHVRNNNIFCGNANCIGIHGVIVYKRSDFVPVSQSLLLSTLPTQYDVDFISVENNIFEAQCSEYSSSSSTTKEKREPISVAKIVNSTTKNIILTNNTLKQTTCFGVHVAYFGVWVSGNNPETEISVRMPTKLHIKLNTIISNRCTPTCDFLAVTPQMLFVPNNSSSEAFLKENGKNRLILLDAMHDAEISDNTLSIDNQYDDAVASFVSFCPTLLEPNSSSKQFCLNFTTSSSLNSTNSLPVIGDIHLNLLRNNIGCQTSSSETCVVSGSINTILLRIPPKTFQRETAAKLQLQYNSFDYFSVGKPPTYELQQQSTSLVPSGNLGVDTKGAFVSLNCNSWSRGFQSIAVASICNVSQLLSSSSSARNILVASWLENSSIGNADCDISCFTMTKSPILTTEGNTTTSNNTVTDSSSTTSTTTFFGETTTSSTTSTFFGETNSSNNNETTNTTTTTTTTTTTEEPPTTTLKARTRTMTFPPLPPPLPPPVSKGIAAGTTAATTASAVIMMEPSAPMIASRTLGLAMLAEDCKDGVIDVVQAQRADPMDFPQSMAPSLYIGLRTDGWRGYLRGAVVANVIMVPIAAAMLVVAVAATIDSVIKHRERRAAINSGRLYIPRRTDLYAKSRIFAVLAVVVGVGLEGATFSIVALIGQKTKNVAFSHDDDILWCFFCGLVPIGMLAYFGITRVKMLIVESSCDPAVIRYGKRSEDVREWLSDNQFKAICWLFGLECWILGVEDERSKKRNEAEARAKQLMQEQQQKLAAAAASARGRGGGRGGRGGRGRGGANAGMLSTRQIQEQLEKEEEEEEYPDDEENDEVVERYRKEYIVKMYPRFLPLFGRFKGTCKLDLGLGAKNKNKKKGRATGATGAEGVEDLDYTSLSELAKQSDAGASRNWKELRDRYSRVVAPYTFFIDASFNILLGFIRGLVTIEKMSCGAGAGLVCFLMILAAIYSCLVLPRISVMSCALDVFINVLLAIAGFVQVAGGVSLGGFASAIITMLALLSLAFSGSRFFFARCKKVHLAPASLFKENDDDDNENALSSTIRGLTGEQVANGVLSNDSMCGGMPFIAGGGGGRHNASGGGGGGGLGDTGAFFLLDNIVASLETENPDASISIDAQEMENRRQQSYQQMSSNSNKTTSNNANKGEMYPWGRASSLPPSGVTADTFSNNLVSASSVAAAASAPSSQHHNTAFDVDALLGGDQNNNPQHNNDDEIDLDLDLDLGDGDVDLDGTFGDLISQMNAQNQQPSHTTNNNVHPDLDDTIGNML